MMLPASYIAPSDWATATPSTRRATAFLRSSFTAKQRMASCLEQLQAQGVSSMGVQSQLEHG